MRLGSVNPTLVPALASWPRWRLLLGVALLVAASACSSKSPTAPGENASGPPTISIQPQSQAVTAGGSATLTVTGTSHGGVVAYQWFVGSSGTMSAPIAGATAAAYTTSALTTTMSFWVRLTHATGSVDSATATITVAPATETPGTAPTIATPPQSQTVTSGQTAALSVAAAGSAPFSFQWYVGPSGTTSAPIAGAGATTYTTPALTTTTSYWVRVSNAAGDADSPAATITVVPAAGPPPASAPAIASEPASQTIASGQTAAMTVAASGTAPLAYQWYAGTSGGTTAPISNATGTTYTTSALTTTSHYWVRVSNAAGSADSTTATITVSPPPGVAPGITTQPQNRSITTGQTTTLSVAASGTAPFAYQWYMGGSGDTSTPVTSATSSGITTPALTATTSFWARVTNAYGAADSAAAVVTVTVDSTTVSFEDQVLVLVNQRRAAGATCGGTPYAAVGPLSMNANLRTAARNHSIDMATNNYFSHTSQDGRTFDQRIAAAGYTGAFPLGENIAAGQSTPAAVVDGWMASPGHCVNIMLPGFRAIGVGYAYNASSAYRHYWTQSFGGS